MGWSFSVTTKRCMRRPVIRLTASLKSMSASQVAQPGVMMAPANKARASSGLRPWRASTKSVCDTTPVALPPSMTTTAWISLSIISFATWATVSSGAQAMIPRCIRSLTLVPSSAMVMASASAMPGRGSDIG